MKRIHHLILCAVILVLAMTAGCTFGKSTGGPNPLVTGTAAASETQPPGATETAAAATAAATQPAAAGTTASGTCPADVSSDAANCGGCGLACPANAVCQQGQCYCAQGYTASGNQCVAAPAGTEAGNGCPSGMSPCPDGYCYDLTADAAHCGACGNTCPSGMICSASTCGSIVTATTTAATTTATVTTTTTSSSGPGVSHIGPGSLQAACVILGGTTCGGSCVNTSTDTGNCGSCGHICSGLTATCCGGGCTNLKTDVSNCGTCGHKCFGLSSCVAGSCQIKTVVTGVVLQTYAIPKVTVTVPIYQQLPKIPGP